MEPNQYDTRCFVIHRDMLGRHIRTDFQDLQLAYLYVKEKVLSYADYHRWHLQTWENTIRLLYSYHMEDRSGFDVARLGRASFTIYYDI